jgi:hypothetical protein
MTHHDIRLLRIRLGLSVAEAAQLCGVQERTWRRWETDTRWRPGAGQIEPALLLLARQEKAVSEALLLFEELSATHGRPGALELAWSPLDEMAQRRGWPTASAWLATSRRIADALPDGVTVKIVDCGGPDAQPYFEVRRQGGEDA